MDHLEALSDPDVLDHIYENCESRTERETVRRFLHLLETDPKGIKEAVVQHDACELGMMSREDEESYRRQLQDPDCYATLLQQLPERGTRSIRQAIAEELVPYPDLRELDEQLGIGDQQLRELEQLRLGRPTDTPPTPSEK